MSDHQPAKCDIYKRLGERVQYDRATSNPCCTLRRARETWQHCRSVRRIYRHLARRLPRCTGGYQSLSHISRPKPGRGKTSEHLVTIQGLLSNKFTDSVETGADMEKAVSRKRPTVPRREHDILSTRPRLRLGAER